MADAHDWAAPPAAPAPPSDADTPARAVADAGAVAVCARLGWDYDALDDLTLLHLQSATWAAFLEMWNAAVEHGLTADVEFLDADHHPITETEHP